MRASKQKRIKPECIGSNEYVSETSIRTEAVSKPREKSSDDDKAMRVQQDGPSNPSQPQLMQIDEYVKLDACLLHHKWV